VNEVLASSITVVVVDRRQGTVDRELLKVGTTVTVKLGIKVRKDTSLQQRIVGKVDTANNVTGLELVGSVISSCGSV
jgi:membrane-bound lytic murein transglycosylase